MFTLTRECPLPPEELWARVAALPDHSATVPLTTTHAGRGKPGVGWQFTVRTALGRLRFDDPMTVEAWDPPRRWRIRKTGLLQGWVEAVVTASAEGSRLTWTEELWLGGPLLRRVTQPVGDVAGRVVFGRVVDRLVEVAR